MSETAMTVARKFLDILNRGDAEAMYDIYTPDAKIWHNFDGKYQTIKENADSLLWLHSKLKNLDYEIVRLEPISGGYLQQHILKGSLASGESFALDAVALIGVTDGRISSLEEYLDPKQAAPLFAKD